MDYIVYFWGPLIKRLFAKTDIWPHWYVYKDTSQSPRLIDILFHIGGILNQRTASTNSEWIFGFSAPL